MKINPIGVQSYQQAVSQRQAQPPKIDQTDKPTGETKVTIPVQEASARSSVAVSRTSGSYAQYLTPAEKEALNLLFQRFADTGRFDSADSTSRSEQTLGRLLDVKV